MPLHIVKKKSDWVSFAIALKSELALTVLLNAYLGSCAWDCRKVNIFIISKKQFIASFFACGIVFFKDAFAAVVLLLNCAKSYTRFTRTSKPLYPQDKIPSPFLARLIKSKHQYCLLLSNTTKR